jgi:hypothetical protein
MKKYLLFFSVLCISTICLGQINYSGEYGYSFKPQGKPPKDEAGEGPQGNLTLLKIDENVYRFWLDVNKGWPSYNMGEADGTITIKGDSAVSDNTYESAENKCLLHFYFKKDKVVIATDANGFDCGFGHGVYADGDYKRKKKQPVMNNAWLKKQSQEAEPYKVVAVKAVLYDDENLTKAKKQYFIKGDVVLNIKENDKAIYTEFIAANGKFIYGWIKKSDLVKK